MCLTGPFPSSLPLLPTRPGLRCCPCQGPSRRSSFFLSALAPAAPSLPFLFATDASEGKGAACVAKIPQATSQHLWQASDRKGAFARMARRTQSLLQRVDPMHEEVPSPGTLAPSPKKPLAFMFDFLELFSSRAEVTSEMSARGWAVGPPIHHSRSPAFDARNLRLLEWIFFLIENDRVRAIFLSLPPQSLPSRLDWDELCRGLAILLKGRSFRVCIVAALPAATAELPDVQELLRPLGKLGIEKTPLSFCAFGSPFRRDTVLLSLRVDLAALDRPCACKRKHTQVRGRRAGRGPVYPWLFAYQVAEALSSGLRRMGREDFAWKVSHEGLERLVATDLALGLRWSPLLVWEWKSGAHINILESSALVRLYTWIAVNFGRARFVNLCDSFVAQAALGKGRSSAPGLRHVSRRSGAVCLAAGLYPGNPYCPTRAMPADHPTRDAPMPPGFGLQRWTEEAILRDAERPRLRRWAANWCRLAGLLVPSLVLGPWPNDCLLDSGRSPHTYGSLLDFDASLGFPGEGPVVVLLGHLSVFGAGLLSMLPYGGLLPGLAVLLGLGCNSLCQGPSTSACRHIPLCPLRGLSWALSPSHGLDFGLSALTRLPALTPFEPCALDLPPAVPRCPLSNFHSPLALAATLRTAAPTSSLLAVPGRFLSRPPVLSVWAATPWIRAPAPSLRAASCHLPINSLVPPVRAATPWIRAPASLSRAASRRLPSNSAVPLVWAATPWFRAPASSSPAASPRLPSNPSVHLVWAATPWFRAPDYYCLQSASPKGHHKPTSGLVPRPSLLCLFRVGLGSSLSFAFTPTPLSSVLVCLR